MRRIARLWARSVPGLALGACLALAASAYAAGDWGDYAVVSGTMGVGANRLCLGEASRGDIGCPTYAPSVTTAGDLYVSGSVNATRFVGDGSGLTGLVSDRISSTDNKSMVVTNAGLGTVSFTLGGVAQAAYLHPTLGLVAAGVSTTGGISGTTGYFSGNVGIGRAPIANYALAVTGTTTGQASAYFSNGNGSSYIGYASSNPAVYLTNISTAPIILATSNTERMRIDSSGNVGIGTSTPAGPLDVSGTLSRVYVDSTGSVLGMTRPGTNYFGATDASGLLQFITANTTRMTISNAGNVGIGTTAPSYALEVSGSIKAGTGTGNKGMAILTEGTGGNSGFVGFFNPSGVRVGYVGYGYNGGTPITLQTDLSGTSLAFATSATERVRIDTSGNVGIGTTAPSATLHVVTSAYEAGRFNTTTSAGGVYLTLQNSGTTIGFVGAANQIAGGPASDFGLSSKGKLWLTSYQGTSNHYMVMDTAGQVGINTTTPTTMLEVSGTISATNVYVTATTGTVSATYGYFKYISATNGLTASAVSSTGAIQFNAGGGAMGGDTSNLYWDNANKRLGIGTSSPAYPLAISGTNGNSQVHFTVGANAGYVGMLSNAITYLTAITAQPIILATSNTERVRIDSSGNVGIGTSSPRQQLSVGSYLDIYSGAVNAPTVPSIRANAPNLIANAYTGGGLYLNYDSGNVVYFGNGAGVVKSLIDSNGNLGIGIGSTAPNANIEVSGTISATTVRAQGVALVSTTDRCRTMADIGTITISATGRIGVCRL